MIPEDPAPSTADGEPAGVADIEPAKQHKKKGRRKDISPLAGARNVKPAPLRGQETEQHQPHIADEVPQQEQGEAETEPEGELVCGYPLHPAAAVFPQMTDRELQALADDIAKRGQGHDIVQHPDGSILGGRNLLLACEIAGCKPRITRWDGKLGEELAYVVSENVRRRQLNDGQLAIIASEIAPLRRGQRQTGKFAGLPTQAEAAEMMGVSERSVRTARKVQEEAPTNVNRLVKSGRISLNAVEVVLPLSAEDKEHIEGLPDDDAEAEIKRLNKVSTARSKRTRQDAADSQANGARAAAAPRVTEASANTADDDDDDNRPIGAEVVARALERLRTEVDPAELNQIAANTPEWEAFVTVIERLPTEVATLGCKLMSCVEQEVRNTEQAAGRTQERDDEHNLGGAS